jgi:hypothetical protein
MLRGYMYLWHHRPVERGVETRRMPQTRPSRAEALLFGKGRFPCSGANEVTFRGASFFAKPRATAPGCARVTLAAQGSLPAIRSRAVEASAPCRPIGTSSAAEASP